MKYLNTAKYLSITLLVMLGAMVVLSNTRLEKYSPVIEEVQPKTVMLTVPSTMEQVFIEFTPSGVKTHTSTVPVNFSGAGVIISPNGHMLSCAHVVDHVLTGPIVAELSNGTTVAAHVLYVDGEKDLALLKMDGNYPYAKRSSFSLRLGQEVIAVGNPMRQSFTSTQGIISHLNRDIEEPYYFTQTDTQINPGNSGGPLFNLDGELIGIVAKKFPNADGMGLAIAPETIAAFLNNFKGLVD